MLNVFLTDILDAAPNPAIRSSIQTQLQGYFDKVAAAIKHPANQPAEQYTVSWVTGAPSMTPQDLLVYFTSTDYSVVSRFSGNKFDPLAVSHWGFTFIKVVEQKVVEAASEVYVKLMDADVLAKLAFHELMHNKLNMGNNMHGKKGLAQASVGPSTTQTPDNISDMAAAARNAIPQWTGGFALMAGAKAARDAKDPLWNL